MRPIGIIGGGQLARMLALAAHPLGLRCRVLDPSPAPPAAAVAEHVRAPFTDVGVLARFVAGVEMVTFELEHLPEEAIVALRDRIDPERRTERAALEALRIARDRFLEKRFLNSLGIDTADFMAVDDDDDVDAAVSRFGLPMILKTRSYGYDGRGQILVTSAGEARSAARRLGEGGLIAEALVSFDRELSIIAVRAQTGEVAMYAPSENHHRDGILRWSLAPAPAIGAPRRADAEAIARRIVAALDYVGVMTIELFQVADRLLVNEIAPRVHNSGHWTIEGADTSQFENHMRAILGLPLGSTSTHGGWVLFNLLGDSPDLHRALAVPGAHLHLYGKEPRPRRKVGHVTCPSQNPSADRARLQELLGLE